MKKIPGNAIKVFEGIFFSVWQWEQQLYDGSTKTFEYVKRPSGSTVIPVTKDGKLIVIEQEQPTEEKNLSFPGGGQDAGETAETCAERELLEETGYSAQTIDPWFSVSAEHRTLCDFYFFIGRNCEQKEPKHEDPGERTVVHLLTLEELLEKIEEPYFKSPLVLPYLIKAKYSETEKQKLKELLGIKTSDKT